MPLGPLPRHCQHNPGPKGGRRQGRERHDANCNRNQTKSHHSVPTTAPAPQTEPQAPQHASVPRSWTARSIAKTQTTATCRGARPTTSTAPTTEAEGEHQTHTHTALQTRCTAHKEKKPDTPKGTLTAAPQRPAQQSPRGKGKPEDRGHTDVWTWNRTQTHHSTMTTATEPRTEPQTPHRVGVPQAVTARSTAPKTRATAAHLNTRNNTTATGTTPRGRNHKRSRWSRKQHSQTRPEDHTHEAPLSVSSGTSSTAMETHSQQSTPPEAPNPPLESLPSGLDVSANHDPMDVDNDPLQDSIGRVLQVAADAHPRPTWSLYRALNKTDQRIMGTGENRDTEAYIQELRRDMQNAQQQSPEAVVVQGRETKT